MAKIIITFLALLFLSLSISVNSLPLTNTAYIDSETLDLNTANNIAQATLDYEETPNIQVVDLEIRQSIELIAEGKTKINIQFRNNSNFVINNSQIVMEVEGITSEIEVLDSSGNPVPFSVAFENGKYIVTIEISSMLPNVEYKYSLLSKIADNALSIKSKSNIISSFTEEVTTNNSDSGSKEIIKILDNPSSQSKIDILLTRTGYALESYTSLVLISILIIYYGIKFIINSNKYDI